MSVMVGTAELGQQLESKLAQVEAQLSAGWILPIRAMIQRNKLATQVDMSEQIEQLTRVLETSLRRMDKLFETISEHGRDVAALRAAVETELRTIRERVDDLDAVLRTGTPENPTVTTQIALMRQAIVHLEAGVKALQKTSGSVDRKGQWGLAIAIAPGWIALLIWVLTMLFGKA